MLYIIERLTGYSLSRSYSLNWGDFTRKINELSNANDRRHYFISGAPIIPPPVLPYAKFQPMLQILQDVSFDFLFIQAYNNPDYENENSTVYWDFWDSWARAKNPSPKLIYGLPGSKDSARDGYQAPDQAQKHISYITNRYPYTFGGAGVWNDATASDNSVSGTNFLKFLKNNLGICNNCAYEKLDGPCREGYPCCSKVREKNFFQDCIRLSLMILLCLNSGVSVVILQHIAIPVTHLRPSIKLVTINRLKELVTQIS